MPVFRLQDNVPDVYTKLSRDFQLLCNVYDCVNDGVKFDIDSIRDISDLTYCNDRLLDLIQTKLGFFTKVPMSVFEQRVILSAFPTVVRNKGSLIGIKQCVELFLKSQKAFGKVIITKTNMDKRYFDSVNKKPVLFDDLAKYTVLIECRCSELDTDLLTALLEYVIPAGYKINYKFRQYFAPENTYVYVKNTINFVFIGNTAYQSKVVSPTLDSDTDDYSIGAPLYPNYKNYSVVSFNRAVQDTGEIELDKDTTVHAKEIDDDDS